TGSAGKPRAPFCSATATTTSTAISTAIRCRRPRRANSASSKEVCMTNMPLVFIAAALALCQGVEPARAHLARTFVSATVGSDANDCNRLTPCRTFQHAHDATLANGEITVLDAGGYGAVTIMKSISIIDDGVGEAGVLVSGGGTG